LKNFSLSVTSETDIQFRTAKRLQIFLQHIRYNENYENHVIASLRIADHNFACAKLKERKDARSRRPARRLVFTKLRFLHARAFLHDVRFSDGIYLSPLNWKAFSRHARWNASTEVHIAFVVILISPVVFSFFSSSSYGDSPFNCRNK